MASFSTQPLYGDAITANLPTDFVDASNLRQIPDYQEVYLSQNQLTTVIFEINEYFSALTTATAAAPAAAASSASEVNLNNDVTDSSDEAAALYHLRDIVDADDTLDAVSAPESVRMQKPGLRDFPALVLRARLTARERERRGPAEEDQDDNSAPRLGQTTTTTTVRLLLVRIRERATDLCVTVNVPWKELEARGEVDEEEASADAILQNVIASLEINDFGLFGGED